MQAWHSINLLSLPELSCLKNLLCRPWTKLAQPRILLSLLRQQIRVTARRLSATFVNGHRYLFSCKVYFSTLSFFYTDIMGPAVYLTDDSLPNLQLASINSKD